MPTLPKKLINKIKKNKLTRKKAITLFFTAGLSLTFLWLFWGIPLPTQFGNAPAVSTKLFDRNGNLIYEIYADQRRTPIPLEELPDHVWQATIAIEDKDFFRHHGFSITGITRAAYKTIFKKKLEGGSTLTQQLVKNTLLSPERTIRRKIREFVLAAFIETRHSKEKILQAYLDQIPYGSTAYGIGAASELYFNKSAKDLSLAESALLAGLPAAPSRYSPFGAHPEYAKNRQKTVLRRMVEDGYISKEEAQKAENEELVFAKPKSLKAPHFALWVKETLAEKYGEAVVERGGLRVTTTLDLKLQEFTQQAVQEEVSKLSKQNVGNGAAMVTRPASGEILAMVGSKDYFAEDEDGKVNIIFARRQPGSSIKPLNYALAIRDGKLTASTALADIPTCFLVSGQKPYCPVNYDGQFHGATQVRFALGNSYNIPAVRVLALNGLENFIEFARTMGITTFTDPSAFGLSLTLGGGEVRPFDMAVAFGVFANQGIKQPLISILKVEDWKGKVLFEENTNAEYGDRVLDPATSFIISHILHDNNARAQAFGTNSYLNITGHPEVSVKTGTTNNRRDNWTIGYTGHIVVVSWVGNNDNSPMSGAVSGVSGASPIFNKVIKEALNKAEEGFYNQDDQGHAWPLRPPDVIGKNICANSGTLPGGDNTDCPMRFEFFLKNYLPAEGAFRQDIAIDKTTQTQAAKNTPPENIEMQNHLVVFDPTGTTICLTCPPPTTPTTVQYPVNQ